MHQEPIRTHFSLICLYFKKIQVFLGFIINVALTLIYNDNDQTSSNIDNPSRLIITITLLSTLCWKYLFAMLITSVLTFIMIKLKQLGFFSFITFSFNELILLSFSYMEQKTMGSKSWRSRSKH